MEWLKKRLHRWQDYGWLVILLVLAFLAYRVIPAIDPRSGIDGFGRLFNALTAAIKGVMATIGAWLCKNLYWFEPGGADEGRWHEAIERGHKQTLIDAASTSYSWDGIIDTSGIDAPGQVIADPKPQTTVVVPPISARWALTLVIKDRIEWAFWLGFWSWVLFG